MSTLRPAAKVFITFAAVLVEHVGSTCTASQWVFDTCPYQSDGECDVDLGYCNAGSDCADCDECSIASLGYVGCDSCVGARSQCAWCASAPVCLSVAAADAVSCASRNGWITSDGCGGEADMVAGQSFSDPAAVHQRWWLEAIRVGDAWAAGVSGAGVNIFFYDDALDVNHPEFAGRFSFAGTPPGHDPSPTQADETHGTSCAGYAAAAANNGVCGVGVAYSATISGAKHSVSPSEAFSVGVESGVVHIHSNSWGVDSCDADHPGIPRQMASCPFQSVAGTSPCRAVECGAVAWGTELDRLHACSYKIVEYCQYDLGEGSGVRDPACADFWDLWVTCSHQALSNSAASLLRNGVTRGRGGRGIIYTFAAGNEFSTGDNVNFEGWLNSIYTISVGATARNGGHAWYSSAGAPLFVTAPGGETGNGQMVTALAGVARGGDCHDGGQGTSYACPIVAGVVALMLEANPELGWRDVQDILARTSQRVDPGDASWMTNGAGLNHSVKYGFGLVDAGAAVLAAQTFGEPLPQALLVQGVVAELEIPANGSSVTCQHVVGPEEVLFLRAVEHVAVYVTTRGHGNRGDLELSLTSPAGTTSVLAWPHNEQGDDYEQFKFMTVRHWGEPPAGSWSLTVADRRLNDASGHLASWTLVVYGKCVSHPQGADAARFGSCSSVLQPAAVLCSEFCMWSGDGECDDGGVGAQYAECSLGTDCIDCGSRTQNVIQDHMSGQVGCTAVTYDHSTSVSPANVGASGGGSIPEANSSALEARVTMLGCVCLQSWMQTGARESCEEYCCNPDIDPGGLWCFVADQACQGTSWGYCRGGVVDISLNVTVGSTVGSAASSRVTTLGCQCSETWVYEPYPACEVACCNPDSDPGGIWCRVEDTGCQGNSWGFCEPPGGGAGASNMLSGSRVTVDGCECRESWQYESYPECTVSCCNPDSDPGGLWCAVIDAHCAGQGWGYCSVEGSSFVGTGNGSSVASSDRDTIAGCACRESWTYQEYPACDMTCCNPDADLGGEWCMVSDTGCQGDFWGYCTSGSRSSDDAAGAARVTRRGCDCLSSWRYRDAPVCEASCCNPDLDPGGDWCLVAEEACEGNVWGFCSGSLDVGVLEPASSSSGRVTLQGCECREAWTQESHPEEPCAAYCCNPDGDSGGEWCFVEHQECEGSSWGHCAVQVQQPVATPSPSSDPLLAMLTLAGCRCLQSWQYQDTSPCEAYCCNPDGDPGGLWCFVEDPLCEGGSKWAYCVNGGSTVVAAAGTTTSAAAAGGGGPTTSAVSVGLTASARGTSAGCRCLRAWTHVSDRFWPRCEDYCCNPSADADGDWCYVESAACQGSDWGYCAAGEIAPEPGGSVAPEPSSSSVLVSAGFRITVSDVMPFESFAAADALRRGISQVLDGVDATMVHIVEISAAAGRRRLGAASGVTGGGVAGGFAVSGEVSVRYDLVFPSGGSAAAAAAAAALAADSEMLHVLATTLQEAGLRSEVREVHVFEPVVVADVFLPSGLLPGEINAQLPVPSTWARPSSTSTATSMLADVTSTSPPPPSAGGPGIQSHNSSVSLVVNAAVGAARMTVVAGMLIVALFMAVHGRE